MRKLGRLVLVAVPLVTLACPASETDLEIVEVRRRGTDVIGLGGTLTLEVSVTNNRGEPQEVTAAAAGDEGRLLTGPAVVIRRNRTEVLTLELPARHPYVRDCEVVATVFLARPSEDPLAGDVWTDPVPENNSRVVRLPVERVIPERIEFRSFVTEVIDARTDSTTLRHYEADASLVPAGSEWAVRLLEVETQNSNVGSPVSTLEASLHPGRLITNQVGSGSGGAADSVNQALVHMTYRDCADAEQVWRSDAIEITRAP